ncbi:AAA family ATPase [Algoriphagus lutimaris]|uniref:3'-5' exonuclease n=1 Tax=Algoriphagus lutimaris TaxID=613197 RepID=UPI00196AB5D3|nr:3'-5' exonuclease [Algoriphagus lutimaris]MBN3520716.1 AAA family ATPase [Algoriphagus lutimaris]
MPTAHANKWFVEYESLDSDQKKLVNGLVFENGKTVGLISGPAGSGKTIILVNALSKSNSNNIAFVSYTRSLLNLADQGLPSNVRAMTYFKALKEYANYDLVVIDEVQDVPAEALNIIISRSKKTLLAGDNFQKIFENGADSATLNSVSKGNVHKLTRTYRLTPRAFAAASKIYPGALEGVSPSGKAVVPIELYNTDLNDEGDFLSYDIAKRESEKRRTSAILLPKKNSIVEFANKILAKQGKPRWIVVKNSYSKEDFGSLNRHLRNNQVKLHVVQNSYGDLNEAFENNEVVIQTYHSAKGLDYQVVCLPNLSVEEATSTSELQRSLFYVAITRASGALIITQNKNTSSSYLKTIEEFCTKMDASRIVKEDDNEDEF